MAESPASSPGSRTPRLGSTWQGHALRPLPDGESWFSGGERRPRLPAQISYPDLDLLDDPWLFGEAPSSPAGSGSRAPAAPAASPNTRRSVALLILVSLAAIATIFYARHSGPPPEPTPLPAPPSHVITAVSRAQATTANIRVGDYLDFRLPDGRTYSTVLEQPAGQIPVVEALTLPGQQPQLRADSAGHAVIEVMSAPICNNPDGCPDQRSLLGTVDLTVTS
jgi:hypothetical protein